MVYLGCESLEIVNGDPVCSTGWVAIPYTGLPPEDVPYYIGFVTAAFVVAFGVRLVRRMFNM